MKVLIFGWKILTFCVHMQSTHTNKYVLCNIFCIYYCGVFFNDYFSLEYISKSNFWNFGIMIYIAQLLDGFIAIKVYYRRFSVSSFNRGPPLLSLQVWTHSISPIANNFWSIYIFIFESLYVAKRVDKAWNTYSRSRVALLITWNKHLLFFHTSDTNEISMISLHSWFTFETKQLINNKFIHLYNFNNILMLQTWET